MKYLRLKYLAQLNPPINLLKYDPTTIISFVPMECVKQGYMVSKEKAIGEYNSSHNCFQNNDVIIAKVTPCFENGNIAIASNLINGVGYGSSELFVLRANKCNSGYLFYLLQSNDFRQMAISTMTGAGGLKRVSPNAVKNYAVPKFNIQEQTRTVSYFDHKCSKIDSIIADKEKLIELLKEKRQSIISEAVTKGLGPSAPMKDSGVEWIGQIPEHWNMSRSRWLFALRKDKAWPDDEQLTASQQHGIIYQKDYMEQGARVVQVIIGEDILKHVETDGF
jgi:type I restriction enzyme S subunit